jgi:hypothetical protein
MVVNSIKYRIKRMEANLNVKNKEEFLDYLRRFDLNI